MKRIINIIAYAYIVFATIYVLFLVDKEDNLNLYQWYFVFSIITAASFLLYSTYTAYYIDFAELNREPYDHNEIPEYCSSVSSTIDVIILRENEVLTTGYYIFNTSLWIDNQTNQEINGPFKWIYKPKYLK